ncbi:Dual oxidase 2 [Nymphon striatum]|nr:Dual oxidase 2 [Nymphon striatum]
MSLYWKGYFLIILVLHLTGSICGQFNVDNLIENLSNDQAEVQSYDGWYNNLGKPSLGAAETPLTRMVKAAYSDGVYQPSGNQNALPLEISEKVMKQDNHNKSFKDRKSKTGKNVLLVFFGKYVSEEILDSQSSSCPPEYFDLKIPKNHDYMKVSGHTKMPFIRSKYDHTTGMSPNNPRIQLKSTVGSRHIKFQKRRSWLDISDKNKLIMPHSWLDGSFLYGTSKGITDKLREFKNGRLATSKDGLLPPKNDIKLPLKNPPPPEKHKMLPVDRLFKVGNIRGNETPFLLTFSVIWLRWHNILADAIAKKKNDWSDERIFTETRKWVIATQQHIIINKWLPMWTNKELPKYIAYVSSLDVDGMNTEYNGYDSNLDPSISTSFQSAAMRFGHTLVPSRIYTRHAPPSCQFDVIQLCKTFWEPYETIEEGKKDDDVQKLILGMVSQAAESEDNMIVDDLRKSIYGPLEFSRRDLMAINIQRGRDHGLPSYLETRRQLGLTADYSTFDELVAIWPVVESDAKVLDAVKSVYENVSDIDVWVGGLLETSEGWPGQLFTVVMMNQFLRIRNADRFWFENLQNKLFSPDEIEKIKKLEFADILSAVSGLNSSDIQRNVFTLPTTTDLPPCMDKYETYECKQNTTCFSLPDKFSNESTSPDCSPLRTYDYLDGSKEAYVATFFLLGIFIIGCITVLFALAKKREVYRKEQYKIFNKKKKKSLSEDSVMANEWIGGKQDNTRRIIIRFDKNKKAITISVMSGQVVRAIDLSRVTTIEMQVSHGRQRDHVLIRVSREYDLVLKYTNTEERDNFIAQLEDFIGNIGVGRQRREVNVNVMMLGAVTKEHRQRELEQFFRVVFAQAFSIEHDEQEMLKLDTDQAKKIIDIELTKYEFAESLSMKPNSTFIDQMFTLVDKDENGYISFREFLDMITIFAKGSADEKIKLMFDMYDIDRTGKMTRKDFSNMIRSMLELANQTLKAEEMENLISSMFTSAGLQDKQSITLQDFMKLVADHKEELGYAQLNFKVTGVEMPKEPHTLNRRQSAVFRAKKTIVKALSIADEKNKTKNHQDVDNRLSSIGTQIRVETKSEEYITDPLKKKVHGTIRFIENYKMHIFWLTVYTLVLFLIFAERMYYYAYKSEHSGLRKVAGYGVAVTRGSAATMMFSFSFILLTMCRNIITYVRETFLQRFIPFDAAISFHKYIAFWALVFTGITGIFLTMILAVIYVFAMQYSRRHVFNSFWLTHNLYPLLYTLIILHGSGDLIQPPMFQYFFLGPCVIFTLDRTYVTHIEFKRPVNFEYKSGQWVRIACPVLNCNEYHPFTLSSAPHEETLSLHIRAVGPWTRNLRMTYDPNTLKQHAYPKIYLDGPYGEGHQDWYRYDVSVLVGGGIGVTPFASILKDIVFKSSVRARFQCKKVYFIWVTRTEKHFEWLTDIIREVEDNDKTNMVSVHIFITQFYQKFDLRTTMLYICERHFQKISNRSLFTGLRSITHFGRPNFISFLDSLQLEHPDVSKIGVFSCGPPLMTRGVEMACEDRNKRDQGAVFVHHYENF